MTVRFFLSPPLSSPQKNGGQIVVNWQGQGLFLQPYCISTIPGGHANLGPPVPGARVERPQYGHYFSDQGLVRGGIYFGHPALHPSGQLTLFKIDPVNFVLVTSCCCRQEATRALTPQLTTK